MVAHSQIRGSSFASPDAHHLLIPVCPQEPPTAVALPRLGVRIGDSRGAFMKRFSSSDGGSGC